MAGGVGGNSWGAGAAGDEGDVVKLAQTVSSAGSRLVLVGSPAALPMESERPLLPPLAGGRQAGFRLNWLGFFVLGSVNNLPYVIVGSAASKIADHFCDARYIGAVTWANVGFGFLAKGLNAFLLLETPYAARLWGMVLAMSLGLVVLAFAESYGTALLGIVLAGAACSFGEGVVLGYLKDFVSEALPPCPLPCRPLSADPNLLDLSGW